MMIENNRFHFKKIYTISLLILVLSVINSGCDILKKDIQLDEIKINAMIDRAKPLIEEITGREFKSKIEYKVLTPDEYMEHDIAYYKKSLAEVQQKPEEDQLKNWELTAKRVSRFYIARYNRSERILYIIPENIRGMQKLYKIKDEDLDDFVFIVMAHEMVHVIDNQHFDIIDFLINGVKDYEGYMARHAVIGGSAAYVTGIIADKLNIPDTSYESSLKLDICMDKETINNKEKLNLYYIKGEEFIRSITGKKGFDKYDSAFLSPPVNTRQIFFPDEYLDASKAPSPDYSELVNNISQNVPVKEGMISQKYTRSTYTLRSLFLARVTSDEDAFAIADNCIGGVQYTAYKQGTNPAHFNVTMLDFIDKKTADQYYEIRRSMEQTSKEQFESKINRTYKIFKDEGQKLEGFDLVRVRNWSTTKGNTITNTKKLTGISGSLYIVITCTNMKGISENEMKGILGFIYEEQLKMKEL